MYNKHMPQQNKHKKRTLPFVVTGIVLALFAWVLVHNSSELSMGLAVVRQIALRDWLIALTLMCLTFICAATAYRLLAFRRLKFRELLMVELAAAGVNRLVPSGLGGLGIHGLFLHKRSHSVAQATTVVSVNNTLGFVAHACLFVTLLLFHVADTEVIRFESVGPKIVFGLVGVLAVILVSLLPPVRRKLAGFMHDVSQSLRNYAHRPGSVLAAAAALSCLTIINVLILYFVTVALGIPMQIPVLFVLYSGAILLGAIVPTPGGLAGVEAGLAGGLIAYGLPEVTAIAITLAFRLITFWFPLIPGLVAALIARRAHLL
jgi:uncharacterized membrane protein YbhN (UPF0104 family)